MTDGVSPALASVSKVGEIVQHILVDVCKHQLLVCAAEDGHADDANVGVLRFWLLWEGDAEQAWV